MHRSTLDRGTPEIFVTLAALVALVASATPAGAQDEAALRSFFEGRHVIVRMDMPATSDGVDVHVGSDRPIDDQQYGDRLRRYGSSIPTGGWTIVTLVKVKKDLIEFQLGGGGFGTFADEWNSAVSLPSFIDKGTGEKELERRIQDETDSHRRRQMERELDELREARERENRRIAIRRAEAEERGRERVAARRLMDGSRFNLRYAESVPRGITPEDVMAALAPYVDFSGAGPAVLEARSVIPSVEPPPPPPAVDSLPRKGMTRDEAEREFGTPIDSSERREGDLIVRTFVFLRGDARITADFVNDTLVRYTASSR